MEKSIQLVKNQLPSLSNIESYVASVQRFPYLTAEEEHDLAVAFQQNQDLMAAQQLILSHLRYVVRIARGYKGYGLAFGDLVQEGSIGLMRAVKRFDPSMGVRLVSFAVHWIKAEIHEYVIRNWRIVKVATTKSQRKLFFNLRKSKKRLGWMTQDEVIAVANDLGVSTKDVLEMESRLNAHDTAFDSSPYDDEEGATFSYAPHQVLEAENADPLYLVSEASTELDNNTKLHAALQGLDPRSRAILERRWLQDEKATFKELAEEYNISIERVRQIEKVAFDKIKDLVQG